VQEPVRVIVTTQVQEFHAFVLENPALREKLKSATDQQSFVKLAVEVGTDLGFSFTHKEVERYINQNLLTLMRQFS
jgi:hypothetical protein